MHTWNVQGLGEISRGTVVGSKHLRNFGEIGEFDFFLVQEHKLVAEKIPFVNKRLKNCKAFWSPAVKEEDDIGKGGLAIFVCPRYADKVLSAGVDKKNAFLWIVVATETGPMGVVNVLRGTFPGEASQNLEKNGRVSGQFLSVDSWR